MIFNLAELNPVDKQYYLLHVVGPRPICFASTIDLAGNVNLSPFSFFNIFSTNPPVVIFSPGRRMRNNTIKHTLENVMAVPEVVINIVTSDMVQQVSLASAEYPRPADEFIKAGFTKKPATVIKPPMVKESKVNLECKVLEIKSLGEEGGAGQLVICEVLVLHLDDSLLIGEKKFDQTKLELVARLGGDWYCRVSEENLFIVPRPNLKLGIGIDMLPPAIRNSEILTGNHLAQLANLEHIPAIDLDMQAQALSYCAENLGTISGTDRIFLHNSAKHLVDHGRIEWAWQLLLLE